MNDILVLPTGPLADASLAIARSSVSRPIVDHSIRSFLFARLLADHDGSLKDVDYDEDLLFAATVMHDLGLGEGATGALVSRSRAPTWPLLYSAGTVSPNATSTEFGRQSHCTRL